MSIIKLFKHALKTAQDHNLFGNFAGILQIVDFFDLDHLAVQLWGFLNLASQIQELYQLLDPHVLIMWINEALNLVVPYAM